MSETFTAVRALVARREIKVSAHGAIKLAADNLVLEEIAVGIDEAVIVEDYPLSFKGPSVLVLQHVRSSEPIHVLWGLARGQTSPAVLITAYRPYPTLWSLDFVRRKT